MGAELIADVAEVAEYVAAVAESARHWLLANAADVAAVKEAHQVVKTVRGKR